MLRSTEIVFFVIVGLAISAANLKKAPGWLGFGFTYHPQKTNAAKERGWLLLETVSPRSPAAVSRLQPRDLIVAINEKPVRFKNDLAALEFLATIQAGQTVTFTVRRGQTTRQIKMTAAPMTDEQFAQFRKNFELAKRRSVVR